ncbi:hypothetical protein PR048_006883 [Dryococelus australis]|uniref:Uncharacterized protein n=1 Tax=Dryococelus australis TaxID=614101 RepID=A0ABQ9IC57_9NEOP|nr:hypothetical protein PR048_006883 [Dryococelus australis]
MAQTAPYHLQANLVEQVAYGHQSYWHAIPDLFVASLPYTHAPGYQWTTGGASSSDEMQWSGKLDQLGGKPVRRDRRPPVLSGGKNRELHRWESNPTDPWWEAGRCPRLPRRVVWWGEGGQYSPTTQGGWHGGVGQYSPTTSRCWWTVLVEKEGASTVTSQLKFPDRLKPTFLSTTRLSFDTDNCGRTEQARCTFPLRRSGICRRGVSSLPLRPENRLSAGNLLRGRDITSDCGLTMGMVSSDESRISWPTYLKLGHTSSSLPQHSHQQQSFRQPLRPSTHGYSTRHNFDGVPIPGSPVSQPHTIYGGCDIIHICAARCRLSPSADNTHSHALLAKEKARDFSLASLVDSPALGGTTKTSILASAPVFILLRIPSSSPPLPRDQTSVPPILAIGAPSTIKTSFSASAGKRRPTNDTRPAPAKTDPWLSHNLQHTYARRASLTTRVHAVMLKQIHGIFTTDYKPVTDPPSQSGGEIGVPRENPPASGVAQHDSHTRKSGANPPGIETESPWWEASALATAPPLPLG